MCNIIWSLSYILPASIKPWASQCTWNFYLLNLAVTFKARGFWMKKVRTNGKRDRCLIKSHFRNTRKLTRDSFFYLHVSTQRLFHQCEVFATWEAPQVLLMPTKLVLLHFTGSWKSNSALPWRCLLTPSCMGRELPSLTDELKDLCFSVADLSWSQAFLPLTSTFCGSSFTAFCQGIALVVV